METVHVQAPVSKLITTPRANATVAHAPGTCGEFFQAALDGQDFLVNCPIDWYAHARVGAASLPGLALANAGNFSKVAIAVRRLGKLKHIELQHRLSISSTLPRGKGMASSTADLTAALAAFSSHAGVALSATEMASLIAAVEPSDCVHYPGIARVDHLSGELLHSYPVPQALRVIVVDCGGEVDTLSVDRERARALYRAEQNRVRVAFESLHHGLLRGRFDWIGRAATESAKINQQLLPKAQFPELLRLTALQGATGVNCAHSGSVLGVLYESNRRTEERLTDAIAKAFGSDLKILGNFAVVGGGLHAR